MDNPAEGHARAVVHLPEFPSEGRPFGEDREEKSTQTMDNESLENSHQQHPNGSPDKASTESFDESSDKSYHRALSSSYSSHDTEILDIRESEGYFTGSAKQRRRLDRKQKRIEKRVKKMRLRRKIKAGKKARAQKREDLAIWKEISLAYSKKSEAFEAESSRNRQCRAAEDRVRDISGAVGADGSKWSDLHQRALELQRVNDDYIKMAVELMKLSHWHFEGRETLHYRADEVAKLLTNFDREWKQAYQRIGDNAVKLKEQALHSAERDIPGLDIEKEPEADEETVRPDRWPTTERPHPIKKPEAHPTLAAKPAKKPAKPRQQEPPPEKLRRSSRLLARKADKKD